ncbi:GATOR complex protein NPRL2-like [Ctenocephalides felis]|nr:GATOR complex protein NPRL2-like isoform X2 [Ctenocephalides felis]XP_026478572.1 GATOR complex protein NPRL2-like isoform X2 [Ctenocephalides felis]XP_026478573.1 GATOR complex protein NPRL2-like isoform X2 [Ctenocephalides felis]XP_026478622.1 GATOR complex protein NPRL2-like [Ctenocephalides felis]XP_026478723.1 GATOR complex protein NPRL2-like [Ctenocephalides felis]XP_026478724.1 GATOR complex protein NPRL2-like [Ctenocephalides felis]XP_026478725.1 GATOR complex protein NPRL2-like [C
MSSENVSELPSDEIEGPIRSIFMCEFHPTAGPKITCQIPENYVTKEVFDSVSVYMIPKAQLQKCSLTVTLDGYKILGYPMRIENKKYMRNAFLFNICLVFIEDAHTVRYEPLLKKLSEYLLAREVDFGFLSQPSSREGDDKSVQFKSPCVRFKSDLTIQSVHVQTNYERLVSIMDQVKRDINAENMCIITDGPISLHLTVVDEMRDPAPVLDHHVPVLTGLEEAFNQEQWDLTTHQILPHIDGYTHVLKIACKAEVHPDLVKDCIQNLVCYKVVMIIPLFQYCSVYTPTRKLQKLASDRELQIKCIEFCSKSARQPATVSDLYRTYAAMGHGVSLRDLFSRMSPNAMRICERSLVRFGVVQGLIRKIDKYPITIQSKGKPTYTGHYTMEEICCRSCINNSQLEAELEADQETLVICR